MENEWILRDSVHCSLLGSIPASFLYVHYEAYWVPILWDPTLLLHWAQSETQNSISKLTPLTLLVAVNLMQRKFHGQIFISYLQPEMITVGTMVWSLDSIILYFYVSGTVAVFYKHFLSLHSNHVVLISRPKLN